MAKTKQNERQTMI